VVNDHTITHLELSKPEFSKETVESIHGKGFDERKRNVMKDISKDIGIIL